MTVSTITGLPADVKRALDANNKPASQVREEEAKAVQGGASLPQDTITASSAPVLDLNAAILRTGEQNREAAKSTLSDEDFDQLERSEESPQEQVQAQAKASLAAQTSKLPPNILQLLVE